MRVEYRFLVEGDDAHIRDGYVVRTPKGTVVYESFEAVKWALVRPVLRDRYKIVRFNKPVLTRFVYEEYDGNT